MAGNCRPMVVGLREEATYTVLSMSSSQGTGGTVENCGLFNGTNPNEWNTSNIFYWYNTTDFLEIEINEDCNIWRSGTKSWATSNGKLNIFLYNDTTSSYDDITSTVEQTTTAIGNDSWEKTIVGLKKGRYKFTISSASRIDSEWYIETSNGKIVIDKIPIIWDKNTSASGASVSDTNPLQASVTGSTNNSIKTNLPLGSGKFYMEFTFTQIGGGFIGICNENFNTSTGDSYESTNQISLYTYGNVYPSQASSGCGGVNVGSIVGIKVDTVNKKMSFSVNGVWGNEFALPNGTEYYPVAMNGSSGSTSTIIANFGASEFTYAVPDGYIGADSGGTVVTYGLLLKSNDKYYSIKEECYDSSAKTYTEIADVTDDSFSTYGFAIEDLITDLTIDTETFKPIDKFISFSLVSVDEKSTLSLKARKSDTQLVTGSGAFNSKVASNIDYFKMSTNVTNNSTIKMAVSIDDGLTWKTTENNGLTWTNLTCTIPLKEYANLTTEELGAWETAKTEINANGFNSADIELIDFNTLNADSIIFAYVLYQDTYDSACDNLSLTWQFDSKGTMVKMSEAECKVALSDDKVIVTPTSDQEMMKINILNGLVDMGGGTNMNPATSTDIQTILNKGW